MLLNSVVIVLREVLEAALVLSVLHVVSVLQSINRRWILIAFVGGVLGSIALCLTMDVVSDWFDGVGQEVVDALIQYGVFVVLAGCVFEIVWRHKSVDADRRSLKWLMTLAVALAMTREGSEVLIYITGFWQLENFMTSVGVGSLLGASIGISVGVLFYYLLLTQPRRRALSLSILLLSLIGAGMCSQATQLLIQADWISVQGPLWDMSDLLPEESLTGQLLYALIGYEASPSVKEVAVYLSSILVMGVAVTMGRARCRRQVSQS